ncbi:MAG: hypothetical protein COZ07_06980 [Candidatus Infernicultor aquiphilus]|uniref:Phage tail assembly protein n=1 Tax=Candidatus Infernicultor aquiphilus TaxID=1805029 RepID=A0A2M7PPH8_9BACT|nr:MAG: hypothetical protein COZ85_02085 [Candidatus Moranbacteria bacterium CG_4_8_14_3_um_filter_34_16]PIY32076.1 MAG: hypothetical protein COZ07_06980 [Candidatus Atribacteria bacterium CG_4_10_14_3_um_filter_34_13]
MDNYLDLDTLVSRTFKIKGKEIIFNLPPLTKLKPLIELENKTTTMNDPEELIKAIKEVITKIIPEIPPEIFDGLNSIQLKAMIKFIVGVNNADIALSKKK